MYHFCSIDIARTIQLVSTCLHRLLDTDGVICLNIMGAMVLRGRSIRTRLHITITCGCDDIE